MIKTIKDYIPRPEYLEKVRPFIGKGLIKAIIGQRRTGKSYILYQIMDEIRSLPKVHSKDILYINKELQEFSEIQNHTDLLTYLHPFLQDGRKKYLFIDEIQDIQTFEKALRDLQAKDQVDLYCSGSNAHLLSSELAGRLGGRYIEIEIFPLNFKEFLTFHKLQAAQDTFFKYLQFGGLPYLKHLPLDEDIVFDYLKNVYNSIVLKDIVSRYKTRNVVFLELLIDYLAKQIGSLFSGKKISDFLTSQNRKISTTVVLHYISFLRATFLIHKVPRFDVIGKKIFEIGEKYYFTDLGLRNSLCGFSTPDFTRLLENAVFLHFKAQGYRLSVGKFHDQEIDFICQKKDQVLYVQVSYLIESEKTRSREFGSLLKIQDQFPKMVLSLDPYAKGTVQGVHHYNLISFLTDPCLSKIS